MISRWMSVTTATGATARLVTTMMMRSADRGLSSATCVRCIVGSGRVRHFPADVAVIEGYIGVPGAGKSLSMTVRAYKTRKLYDEVVSNYSLNRERFKGTTLRRFSTADQLLSICEQALGSEAQRGDGKRRLLLIDEVHLIFDARMWSKVPQEFLRVLAQPRKAHLDMLYTAQHESQVEKRLRVVTNYLHLCKSWGKDFNFFSDTPYVFWSTCYESFEFRKPHAKDYGKRFYRFKKSWGDLYDTMEVLDRMSLDGIGTGVSPAEPV